MHIKTTSRRDDIQSLCYLLIYIINGTRLIFHKDCKMGSASEIHRAFKKTLKQKENLSIEELCSEKAKCLIPFVQEAFAVEFK
jgi:hypothetical protein